MDFFFSSIRHRLFFSSANFRYPIVAVSSYIINKQNYDILKESVT